MNGISVSPWGSGHVGRWGRAALLLSILGLLLGCRAGVRRPPVAHLVQDRWQVVVARDGLVQIERTVELDEQVSRYLRGSSSLAKPRLFAEMSRQVSDECGSAQNEKGALTLHCRLAYRIVLMPTEHRITLGLPDDLLLGFLTHSLAYQPLAVRVWREISVVVPGKPQTPSSKQLTRFSAYASQSIRVRRTGSSKMQITTTTDLLPGDVPVADVQRLPPIEFEPIPGMP